MLFVVFTHAPVGSCFVEGATFNIVVAEEVSVVALAWCDPSFAPLGILHLVTHSLHYLVL